MNSPSSYSSPATTNLKRHSLNVSTGPRPLHLVDGNVPSTFQLQSGPATAPLYSTSPEFSTPSPSSRRVNGFNHKPRRQSSISYHPKDRYSDRDTTARSPLSLGSPKYALSRSNSLGPKSSSPISTPGDRESKGFDVTELQERPPLTLVEK